MQKRNITGYDYYYYDHGEAVQAAVSHTVSGEHEIIRSDLRKEGKLQFSQIKSPRIHYLPDNH